MSERPTLQISDDDTGPLPVLVDSGLTNPPLSRVAPAGPAPQGHAAWSLLIPVLVVVTVLAAVNMSVYYLAKRTQRNRLLAELESLPLDTEVLVLGNSLMEAGCDMETLESNWPSGTKKLGEHKLANLALGATSPAEHFLILHHALERPLQARLVVYGFFDDQLYTPVRGDWSDLEGNRALSYKFPRQAADLYAPGSRIKEWELRMVGWLPMLAERSSVWSKVEMLRRRLQDLGMPPRAENRFGRVDDFFGLEAADARSFETRSQAALKQAEFSRPIEKMIELCKARGIQVVFIAMPMPSRHRELFYNSEDWRELQNHTRQLAAAKGAAFLEASEWVLDDSLFEDATHLSPEGAKAFSGVLASHLKSINSTETAVLPQR